MTQRTWFITGTSSGFGLQMTELLLERGDRVAATARNLQPLDSLKARYGDQLWTAVLDVTDTTAVRSVVQRATADLERIDVVVSNAGYGLFGAAEEVTDEQIRHQFDTNVMGSIQLIRAMLPHLRAQGGGRILQITSMGGQIAMPALSLYHATKWAMEGFCESLISEVAPFNIQVTMVEPGGARTEFAGRSAAMAPVMEVYENSVVGALRQRVFDGSGEKRQVGDPLKMARAMIAVAGMDKQPKRLALGSDAYKMIQSALNARLLELEAHKNITLSTDV